MSSFSTRLTSLLNIPYPIVCPPMAGACYGALAGAVAKAGGVGFLGVGYTTDPNWIREQWAIAQETAGPNMKGKLGIGAITWWAETKPDILAAIVECCPELVWFSFGDPTTLTTHFRTHLPKTLITLQLTSPTDLPTALPLNPDILVLQGLEAGGHGATTLHSIPLFTFLSSALRSLHTTHPHLPILAAGGISTGTHIASYLTLGSDGVVLGTAFLPTHECTLPFSAKQLLISSSTTALSTIRSKTPDRLRGIAWPDEYDFRIVRNRLTAAVDEGGEE
ncbi:hypothetical protein HK097_004369, partial [Rhizophlyctis rosea]